MRKCEFRLRLLVKDRKDGKVIKHRYVQTNWLKGYFHIFFQQGALDEFQGEFDCGMQVEDTKGHIHTIWNDQNIRMRDNQKIF